MTVRTLDNSPLALILDYGGVIVSTTKRPTGFADLAAVVDATLRRAGMELPIERLEQSMRAGVAALKDYNNMSSRRRAPLELDHRTIVADFLASDLPDRARTILTADAERICQAKVELLSEHTVRPGLRELLGEARSRGIRTGVASNAQSGAAHRAFIEASGLTDLFDVQLYSDEIGVRKPHPDMLHMVAAALDVPIEQCWYVGDTRDRDLLAGRRAGVGAVVLIRHHHTDKPAYAVEGEPEAVFEEVTGLAAALAAAGPAPVSEVPMPPAAEVPASPGRPAAPKALLLDNGGILSLSTTSPEGVRAFAGRLHDFLARAGHTERDVDQLVDDIAAARERYKTWKRAHDLGDVVPEVSAVEFWGELVAADWTPGARTAVTVEARELIFDLVRSRAVRVPAPGMEEVLRFAAEHGIRIGIVSNTVCGRVARENHAAWGFAPYIGVAFYSDEFGFRKPDRTIVDAAAEALGVDLADCWFVGDKPGRDVEGARRAGVGTTVLIDSPSTPHSAGPVADLAVGDAAGLLAALREAVRSEAVASEESAA